MPAGQPRREGPTQLQAAYIAGIDLVERAEAGAGIVFGCHRPLPVIRLILNLRECGNRKKADENSAESPRLADSETPRCTHGDWT